MPAADRDEQDVVVALEAALAESGLSLRQFAAALGTSPSRFSSYRSGHSAPSAAFVFRATRLASALARARDAAVPSSLDAARAIQRAQTRGDEDRTLAVVLEARDRLAYILERTPDAAEAWEAQPTPGLSQHWGVLLAAFVAQCFVEHGRLAPRWTTTQQMAAPWFLDSPRLSPQEVRARTPEWLAERNLFAAPRDLATV